jgi:hypothetical protein
MKARQWLMCIEVGEGRVVGRVWQGKLSVMFVRMSAHACFTCCYYSVCTAKMLAL